MLTEADRAVLDLEARFWKYQGAKEAAIRGELSLSPTRYYQVLSRLLDDPQARAYAPMVASRLRRVRSGRRDRAVLSQGQGTGRGRP